MNAEPTNYSLSVDCTPSNFHTNFKAYLFIALTIDWFKIMVMFYCTFGYQRNDTVFGSKHLRVPASEMLLLMGGKGNESQLHKIIGWGEWSNIYLLPLPVRYCAWYLLDVNVFIHLSLGKCWC